MPKAGADAFLSFRQMVPPRRPVYSQYIVMMS